MKRDDASAMIVVRLDADDALDILRFQQLCDEKFGKRFQQDKNFRHQSFDALLAAVADIE